MEKSEYRIFRETFINHKKLGSVVDAFDSRCEYYANYYQIDIENNLLFEADPCVYRLYSPKPSELHLYCICYDPHNIILGMGCIKNNNGPWQNDPIAKPVVEKIIKYSNILLKYQKILSDLKEQNMLLPF